ncbi:MAG: amidohydrolase [Anaerolineae bacterium]|nr:amidohydrolase [Anaerolineae bacterium]
MSNTVDLIPQITARAADLREKLVATRRELHANPELSGEEAHTAQVIAARLGALGLGVHTEVGGYGIVAVLHGAQPGAVVAYRADMDALPIQDALETPYRSQVLGVKHACGHDAHVAIALGAAEILATMRESLAGTVVFIFQPAEESLDGAKAMIADGVLENAPRPEAIFAQHVFPFPVGKIGVSPGLALAGMDEYRVRFYCSGRSLKVLIHQAADALRELSSVAMPTTLTEVTSVLQSMQESDAHSRTAFISCWVQPPDMQRQHLLVLVSTSNPEQQAELQEKIRETLRSVCDPFKATFTMLHTFTNPPVVNDAALMQKIMPWVESVAGAENILHFRAPYPFAHEDFALYQQSIPGVFLCLGTANEERGLTAILHQPAFDIDEDALVIGARLAATLLAQYGAAHAAT